jgi:hypothetical protein
MCLSVEPDIHFFKGAIISLKLNLTYPVNQITRIVIPHRLHADALFIAHRWGIITTAARFTCVSLLLYITYINTLSVGSTFSNGLAKFGGN